MKTKLLIMALSLALTPIVVHAQDSNLETMPFKDVCHYGINIADVHNLMQQRNGDIIVDLYSAYSDNPIGVDPVIVGNLIYKLSASSLQCVDSLMIADSIVPEFLFARNPRGEGNIRANIEPDSEGNSRLRISHFTDDNLFADPAEDIVVPLCEGRAFDFPYSSFLDCQGNIILKYYKEIGIDEYEGHIARYGIDGSLMCETLLPSNLNYVIGMDVFSESPLEYYEWRKGGGGHLNLYVLDSSLQLKNTYVFNKVLYEDPEHLYYEWCDYGSSNSNSTFVIPDGDDVLVASEYYVQDSLVWTEYGIVAARYNLRTMQRKAMVQFNDYPGQYARAKCYGFCKMQDGSIYLLYREQGMPVKYWMTVVKMDSNLNVDWKRYCPTPEGMTTTSPYSTMTSVMLKDEDGNDIGFAIAGISTEAETPGNGFFCAVLTHDGIPASVSGGIEVRPYMFYPNPAQDQLHLQYSPDVQPKHVELYDLQGRLVRSQGNAFETVDLGQLPAGTYTLRVTMQDGQSFSDMVVKE